MGEVITPKPWTRNDTVWVVTNCSNVPIREIRETSIIDARVLSDTRIKQTNTEQNNDLNRFSWEVAGKNQSVYNVLRQQGRYTCTCPGFQFRGHCRHVEQIRTTNKEVV